MRMFVFCLAMIAAVKATAAEDPQAVFVKPAGVALLATPAPDAVVSRRLAPGDRISILGRQPGFVNVQTADGFQGWLRESDITAAPPAAIRIAGLEEENSGLQEQVDQLTAQLSQLRNELNRAQSQARRAEAALNNVQDNSGERITELEADKAALQEQLKTLEAEKQALLARVAELEMAQSASRLLAESQAAESEREPALDWRSAGMAGVAGLGLLLVGGLAGANWKTRRIRQRYHGLEL